MAVKLANLLGDIHYEVLQGCADIEISDISYNSQDTKAGDVFVCMSGAKSDGHDYIDTAVKSGAVAVVVSRETEMVAGVTYVRVTDTRETLALMSCAYFGNPSHELDVIGITGTKGKTTITYMIKRLLEHFGYKVGLIGTIQTIIGSECRKSKNTTPESYELQKLLRQMADSGCKFAVLEVSSQGLKMHRVTGTRFPLGIYTNFSRDHIGENEHKDMDEYASCKSLFFRMCESALVNTDCSHWRTILKDSTCSVRSYGLVEGADLRAFDIRPYKERERLCVKFSLRDTEFTVGLPGAHTVYNALASIGVVLHFGLDPCAAAETLLELDVPGRTELVAQGLLFTVLIDYAHNELSMESLLLSLHQYNPNRLICLFGCGGNRDKSRRYAMGKMVARHADLAILSEDNPRFERAEDIISDIVQGMNGEGRYEVIVDRESAIIHMLNIAEPNDICAIIGKGHEDYQEIGDRKIPFSEKEIIKTWADCKKLSIKR